MNCGKCGEHLEAAWAFCPHCAARIRHKVNPREHEKAPVKESFSGLVIGLIAAPMLIIAGGMICLTGLGVFLGIPLILLGVCAPLVGPMLGMNGRAESAAERSADHERHSAQPIS